MSDRFYSLFFSIIMTFATGSTVFLPGQWDITTFVFSYILVIALPILFGVHKVTRTTKVRSLKYFGLFSDDVNSGDHSLLSPSLTRNGRSSTIMRDLSYFRKRLDSGSCPTSNNLRSTKAARVPRDAILQYVRLSLMPHDLLLREILLLV